MSGNLGFSSDAHVAEPPRSYAAIVKPDPTPS